MSINDRVHAYLSTGMDVTTIYAEMWEALLEAHLKMPAVTRIEALREMHDEVLHNALVLAEAGHNIKELAQKMVQRYASIAEQVAFVDKLMKEEQAEMDAIKESAWEKQMKRDEEKE